MKVARRLPGAIDRARNALRNHWPCASLFALGTGLPEPTDILDRLARADPSVGLIIINEIESPRGQTTSATAAGFNWQAVPVGQGATQLRATFVQVTINSLAGTFVDGDETDRAVTILHELGHVYSFLYGPSSTLISEDRGDTSKSEENSRLARKHCF